MAADPDPETLERWRCYVRSFAELLCRNLEGSVGFDLGSAVPAGSRRSPRVVLCSPHPDDEVLAGLLPLRLLLEDGARVTNLAVTLGSNPDRWATRRVEMRRACGVLGFAELVAGDPEGFEGVSTLARGRDPAAWQRRVEELAARFAALRPDLLMFPHANDAHPTHVGTHYLALAAALRYSRQSGAAFLVAETEFWHPLSRPNLLVGANVEQLALLIAALCEHRGELARTPYHLMLPARMMETARRSGERLKGYGAAVTPCLFGEAYRVSRLARGVWQQPEKGRSVVPPSVILDLGQLLAVIEA